MYSIVSWSTEAVSVLPKGETSCWSAVTLSPSFSFLTLKVGNVDGCVSVLFFLSGGVVAVVLIFLVGMEVESPTPSDAFFVERLGANLDCGAGDGPSRLAAYAAESNPVEGFQNDVLLPLMLVAAAWHVAGAWYLWNAAAGELGFPAADGSVRLLNSEGDRELPPYGEAPGEESSSNPRVDRNW